MLLATRRYGYSSHLAHSLCATAVYSIVLQRLKSREELQLEQDGETNYEEQLAQANVATLSRAQRRARARQIMKQQRRAAVPMMEAPPAGAVRDGVVAEGEGPLIAHADPAAGADDDDHDARLLHANQPVLSRKERQRLAKLAEKGQRKLLEQERKQQQEEAQKQAKQAKLQRLEAQTRQQQEARQLQLEERRLAKEAAQRAWETFICGGDGENKVLLVEDWLAQCKSNRYVDLGALADDFAVCVDTIKSRILQLVDEQRVTGVFTPNETMFVVFDETELVSLANMVRAKGYMSTAEIAAWMNQTAPIPSPKTTTTIQ